MAEPRWVEWDEKRVGDSNADGEEDTMNRAMKDFYGAGSANFGLQHNDDGTHKLAGFLVIEQDTFSGTGVAHTEALTNTSMDILCLWIARADTEYPVFRSADMANTKQLGTAALQADMITDISTTGEFDVGTDVAVNDSGVTYHYLAIGVEA